jgi:CHAD domain-containing protein
LGSVAQDFRRRRMRALERAETAVGSPRFRRLVLDAAAWIEIGDWTRKDDELDRTLRERALVDAATEELRRRRSKIRRRGERLAELDELRRHKLRIRAKKLRYACEFFGGAFSGKKSVRRRKKFIAKLKRLQDALGDLNDIVVHEKLARRAITPRGAGRKLLARRARKAFAAGRLSGCEEARFAAVKNDAKRAYAAFAKAAPFWQ